MRLAQLVVTRPGAVLLAAGLLALVALGGIVDPGTGKARLKIDPSLDEMLPDDDDSRRFYSELLERFGSDDVIAVALRSPHLFSTPVLSTITRLTERLAAIDGVHHVDSLANALYLSPVAGDLEIAEYLEDVPTSAAGLARLGQRVRSDPLRAGTFVSDDGTATVLLVTFDLMDEAQFMARGLDLEVAQAVRSEVERVPGLEFWLAGTPYLKAEVARILQRELSVMVPVVFALMTLLSCVFFRGVRVGLVPLAALALGMVYTLGMMGYAGKTLDVVTTLIPPLILALGFAYAAHVAAAFQTDSPGGAAASRSERARRALEHTAFPVTFTALTTAAGFLSLCFNSLRVIRGFGLWSAVSAFVTLAAALTVVPALLALGRSPAPGPRAGSAISEPPRLDRVFARLARFDVRHRRAILVAGALLFAAALAASSRIQVNLAVIENFRPDSPVRQGYEAINRLFGGANQFYVMLEADRRGAFEEPEVLRAVDSLQTWLESQPEIGRTTSVVQYLEVINAAMAGKRSIPGSQALAAQLLLFGANEELDQLIDPAHRVATILVRSSATETHQFDDLATRIDRRLQELPAGIRGEATGDAILLTRSAHRISRGQVLSLAAACGMIGLLLVGYFRSLRVGLYALVPNVLPVAIYFGILGATGITLNNATALMGSIVLGVAVDDTLHLLVGYRRAHPRARSAEEAVSQALVEVGRPITGTTLAVALGLLVVGASALQNQAQFGLLGAATLVIAWAIDLTFTPALCAILDSRERESPERDRSRASPP